jgi:hypothetical protein
VGAALCAPTDHHPCIATTPGLSPTPALGARPASAGRPKTMTVLPAEGYLGALHGTLPAASHSVRECDRDETDPPGLTGPRRISHSATSQNMFTQASLAKRYGRRSASSAWKASSRRSAPGTTYQAVARGLRLRTATTGDSRWKLPPRWGTASRALRRR